MQIEEELRANIIKQNLDGIARTIISESIEDESEIINILTENFGDETHILIQLRNLHFQLGMVPDPKNNQKALQQRAEVALEHLNLMKRAEVIQHCDELYSSYHLHKIFQFLPIDDQLKGRRIAYKGFASFNTLKSQFEDIYMSSSIVSNNSYTILDSYSHNLGYSDHITGTTTEQHAMIITGDENKHENSINFQELILKIKKQEKIITAYKELTKQQEQVLCQLRKKCQSPQLKRVSRYNISYSKGQKDQKVLDQFTPLTKDVDTMIAQNNKQTNKDQLNFTFKQISNNIDLKIDKLYRKTPPPGPLKIGLFNMSSQPQSYYQQTKHTPITYKYEDPLERREETASANEDHAKLEENSYDDWEPDVRCKKYFSTQTDEDIGIMTEEVHNDFYFLDHRDTETAASILISEVFETMDSYNSDLNFDNLISQPSDPGG